MLNVMEIAIMSSPIQGLLYFASEAKLYCHVYRALRYELQSMPLRQLMWLLLVLQPLM